MAEEAPVAGVVVSGVQVQVSVPSSKAEDAVCFYKKAFGAEEVSRSSCSKRKADQEQPSLLCSELKIGATSFLICGVLEDPAPVKEGAALPVRIRVQVEDTEAAINKAVQAGAVLAGEACVEDACCGKEPCEVVDPFGVSWLLISPAKATDCEAEA